MNQMTRIWERLWLGSLKDAESLATSNPLRITTVLTLCPELLQKKTVDITYIQIPVHDGRALPSKQFEAIMSAVWGGVRRGRILVHCAAGYSRSPILTASWMHSVGYKNIDAALSDIGRLRSIDPSPILLKSVKEML